ncbi:RING-H2 finger protein ATL78-like [Vigna unguiculata]|uniref:RING-type E3 ubiquitin transferase n=1 Tax=Vigna unguiculata TaxID=3917 RepID=A0A4D6NSM7_VIGUN|nr:RING-H2 finger protein ATL78-like [Vigna unguiculata]QCE15265.1 E3 ubiquitin-protein ligase [Vigna unguiculata]
MYSAAATFFLHDLQNFHSRRLLLHSPLNQSAKPPATPHDSTETYLGDGNFDANVVMVLSVLLCALICSLGLNSIIRCALRCSNFVVSDSVATNTPPARVANTGVKKKALKTFPTVIYSAELNLPSLDSECVICLSEFTSGEKVRILPKCNHGFHVRCIDMWLSSHSSCPKCRHCLIETCQKIVGCTQQASSSQQQQQQQPVLQVPETILTITPLEPEGLVRNYREL